jgi:hypothetical protein
MKKVFFALFVCILFACGEEEISGGKEVRLRFEAFELDSRAVLAAGFSSLRVIVLQDNVVVRYLSFPAGSFSGNELSVNLPVGRYKLLFIANGPEEKEVSCNVGDPLESVTLNLFKDGDAYREASDFLTASKQVNIAVGQENVPISIALRRRVGKIRVTLNGLPSDVDSLKIELGNAPRSSSVNGKTMGSAVDILKRVPHVKGSGTATVDVMTFPIAANKAEVGVLYSIGHVTYRGFMTLTPAVDSNRVVTVTGNYVPALAQGFKFDVQSWDESTLVNGGSMSMGEHDDMVADNTPATGSPVGNNLLANGGFETWTGDAPSGWSFDSGGANKTARKNSATAFVAEGLSSCLLGERTYIYQDIPVTGRRCYQIRVKVNSNTSAYKWRVFCTWRRIASSSLSSASAAIQSSEKGATGGWVDVFGSANKFRAPVEAKILRVEVRAYSAGSNVPGTGEGVYVDDLDVRLLE